jgi:peptidoglycan lytic transglycosylase
MYASYGHAVMASTNEFLDNLRIFATARDRRRRRDVRVACLSLVVAVGGCANGGGVSVSNSVKPMFPESKWGVSASKRVASTNTRISKGGGVYKVGTPYQVGGKWYDPREQPNYDRVGIASWYGADFHGRKTGNGEIYDMNALTAAHPTLPMPSYAYVTNVANGRTVLVRINDRGPYVGNRIIDLSKASARALDLHKGGTGRVRVKYAGKAPLNGNDSRERQFLASRKWTRGRRVAARRSWNQRTAALQSGYGRRSAQARPARAYSNRSWSPAAYRSGLLKQR